MADLKVTLVKSTIGSTPYQKKVVKALGLGTREIAEKYGTNVHNVNAWISKARKKLYAEPEFMAAIS